MSDPKRPEDLPRLTDEERAELDSGYVAIEGVPVGEEPLVEHTPDPWDIVADGELQELVITSRPGPADSLSGTVCTIQFDKSGKDHPSARRKLADAHLIATAPTLVRELEDAADMFHEIALECAHCNYGSGATGKSSDGGTCEECAPTREAERRARAAVAKARGQS